MSYKSWVEKTFTKRECVHIVPSSKDPHRCLPGCQICQQLVRCCCGRLIGQHSLFNGCVAPTTSRGQLEDTTTQVSESWSVEQHTVESPTDAYGIINFQGGSRCCKAKYMRLSHDSKPEDILELMLKEWQMELPKLLISVHGGMQKFELHPRIKQSLSKGLFKAAVTTGAWIVTGGINTGAAKHVGDALNEHASKLSRTVCTIGIAPWGVVENRNDLIGRNVVAPYQTLLKPLSKLSILNNVHSHFLLVDDGTVGKYGAEVNLRRTLEKTISLQQIHARIGQGVPVVALVVEGGPGVILTVLEYLQQSPPVPVVVCEGTGRAADLLASLHKQTGEGGALPEEAEFSVFSRIKNTFNFSQREAAHLFHTLMECMKSKGLITVFHMGAGKHQDIDVAILKALLKGMNASTLDQLTLTLAWDRVDIAKNHIFAYGQQWTVGSLEQAMLDALVMDRVAFVKLLIENGVSIHRFLTIGRLEELYNTKQGPTNPFLFHLLRDVKKANLSPGYKITLTDVGLIINFLMGGTYRCSYTRKRFRTIYKNMTQEALNGAAQTRDNHIAFSCREVKKEKQRHNHFIQTAQPCKPKKDSTVQETTQQKSRIEVIDAGDSKTEPFPYPFNELLVWAVLMRRQKMALLFWQHGEQLMAKALVARKLYRAMSSEAKQSEVIDDTSEELKEYSNEFGELAVELLDQSYKQNETLAMKLLMYELKNWSKYTCLKLAVSSRHRTFVGHTCAQMLLSDIWMGRLNMRKNSWYKVIFSILVPPAIYLLEYKTNAEMSHIPQSEEAHQMTMENNNNLIAPEGTSKISNELRASEIMGPKNGPRSRQKKLSIAQKWHDFYHAPIVKFWFNTLAYLGFLMLYTYVVLVEMENLPSVQEWIVIIYIFTSAVEKIREMLMSEAGKIKQKMKVWFSAYLNISDTVAIVTFFIGSGLRFGGRNNSYELNNVGSILFIAGRLIYCLNIIFWYVRLMDFLNVNQHAGPYVLMLQRMVKNMFPIVVIMAIILLAYGVPRKAVLYPHEKPAWSLARDILFEPYWMTFGEMFAYEIDVCANNTVVPGLCGPGTWLTPILQAVYCFAQYIIMVNLLIAFFNNVYMQGKMISNILWKYQRYHAIMAHLEKPVLPPPLIIFSYLSSMISCLFRGKREVTSHRPKLFLTEEDEKKLHDFEERCAEIYFNRKEDEFQSGSEQRIRVTSERVEQIAAHMKEVGDQVCYIKHSLRSLDAHIGHLQDLSALTLDTMKKLAAEKASEASKVKNAFSREMSISENLGQNIVNDDLLMNSKWKISIGDFFGSPLPQDRHDTTNNTFLTVPSWNNGSDLCIADPELERGHDAELSESHINIRKQNGSAKSLRLSVPRIQFFLSTPSEPSCKYSQESQLPNEEAGISKAVEDQVVDGSALVASSLNTSSFRNDLCAVDSNTACHAPTKMCIASGGHVNMGFVDDEHCVNNHKTDENNKIHMSDHQVSVHSKSLSSREKTTLVSCNQTYQHTSSSCGDVHNNLYLKDDVEDCVAGHAEEEKSKPVNGPIEKGILQRLWTNYKTSGGGNSMQHLMPEDSRSAVFADELSTYCEMSKTKTLATSTELQQKSLPEMSAVASSEATDQADSKTALLMDLKHSRSSSDSSNKRHKDKRFNEIDSPFKPIMDITFYYTAVERNNLMRLSQSIPFNPVPPRGELVSVYRLEESSPGILNNSMSSWSQEGLSAKIEFISKEEMGGGLRRAVKVLCTWSEDNILNAGKLYIIKSFLPEVVNTWASIYQGNTVLYLCLREIQQQRAAQKLLCAFNSMKPKYIPYSPRFLEVFLLYCHSSGQWFTVEEYIAGRFRKYNNNNGDENVPESMLEQTMLAFSHWTYEYTRGELLVLDLQGVGENLTDPSVIKAGETRSYDMVFGPANLGEDAIKNFRSKHHCNSCCRKLKLPDLKRDEYLPVKETCAHDDPSSVTFQPGNSVDKQQQPVRVVL
ncbi:transient receptor potential cation channel subfamily M member 7-like isoform X2 [Pleurodeles waltl]|uniref:transient receptor potential cation channel subfamily M member 7-like isoform X2 n=1 Tax=Pleurodeles waltl TaxID=8319 RepID=UPI00370967FD